MFWSLPPNTNFGVLLLYLPLHNLQLATLLRPLSHLLVFAVRSSVVFEFDLVILIIKKLSVDTASPENKIRALTTDG